MENQWWFPHSPLVAPYHLHGDPSTQNQQQDQAPERRHRNEVGRADRLQHVAGQAVVAAADAELAQCMRTPALDPTASGEGAGVGTTRGDGADPAAQSADIDRNQAIGVGAAVTKLSVAVAAPALDPAADGEGAGVGKACGDGADPAAQPADIDRG